MKRRLALLTLVLSMAGGAPRLWAQLGRGMPGGGRMGPGKEEKKDKPKVAEQGAQPAKASEPERVRFWGLGKPIQFFQVDGYFRMRSDVFYKLHLGLPANSLAQPPFTRPLEYYDSGSGGICADGANEDCKGSALFSTNMRFRLAPTFNLHARARIRMTLDIFDNFVLGSTPEGYGPYYGSDRPTYASLNSFSTTQEVPQAARNSLYDAIQVKHVWGEVDLPFGRLMFGRMPSHWGLGILANSGRCSGYAKWRIQHHGDPGRCMDSDYGDIADRIQFATKIPVVDLLVGFSWDFHASGLTTLNLQGQQRVLSPGQPYDLTSGDNVQQWVAFLGRIDSPLRVKERLAQGEVVFNYGTYWIFRRQKYDYPDGATLTGEIGDLGSNLVRRGAFVMIPDVWLRLVWGKLQLEAEGVFVYGWIRHLEDVSIAMDKPNQDHDYNIQQWGWVFRGRYSFLRDTLHVRLEMGMASGDDRLEDTRNHQLHYRALPLYPTGTDDSVQSLFRFNPDYRVDLIFFREIMGTVYNAGYVKPSVSYDILKTLTARVDMIYSFAMEPVATPGNNPHYGVELDADVEYRWPEAGFYVGLAYGVFFPLGALDWPASIFGSEFAAEAKIAQTVQLRAELKF